MSDTKNPDSRANADWSDANDPFFIANADRTEQIICQAFRI